MRKRCPYNKQPGVLLVQLNFYFIFTVFHTELLAYNRNTTLNHPIYQVVQYIEYHCVSVQGHQHLRVPVLNNFSRFSPTP